MWDNRELPDGARQSEAEGELALEQPTESRAQASWGYMRRPQMKTAQTYAD